MPARRRAVLFDVDGTLVDSNRVHASSWAAALRESGFGFATEQILPMIGMGGDKVLAKTTGLDERDPRGARITERSGELVKSQIPGIRPFPKARELLLELRSRAVLLGVATSGKEDDCKRLLDTANVRDLIDVMVTSADAAETKPDPDIVACAVQRTGLSADRVLLVGDTPYDVESATRSGIITVAVRSGGWQDDALAGAIAVYDDVADVLARLDSEPLATWLAG